MQSLNYRLADYQLAASGKVRWPMAASMPEPLSLNQLLTIADSTPDELFSDLSAGYASAQGDEALRTLIADEYEGLSADNILLFSGANEAIYAVNKVLLNPADRIQVVTPVYEPLMILAEQLGVQLAKVPMRFEDDCWFLDVEQWLDSLSVGTKMATINFPHNPTGAMLSHLQLQLMVDACRERDCWLFADEVFRGLEYDSRHQLPAVASVYEKGISLGAMSKSLGLAGVRIGWIATQDKELLQRLLRFKHCLSVCHGQADAVIARLAMQHKDAILQLHRQLLKANLEHLSHSELFMQYFHWAPPLAGCVSFPRLKEVSNVRDYTDKLLATTGILLIPGQCFIQGDAHVRLGFGRADLPQVLNALESYLSAF